MPATRHLHELARLLHDHWNAHAERLPGGVAPHRIGFSKRIVASWAYIYYRRRDVRLSPYVFLLPEERLPHGSDWNELAATVLHELAHAHVWALTGDGGHPPAFASTLEKLGVPPNGCADLGPANVAFRHRYECRACGKSVLRRSALPEAVSCATCAPGGYDERFRLVREPLEDPWARLADAIPRIEKAIEEGKRARSLGSSVTAPKGSLTLFRSSRAASPRIVQEEKGRGEASAPRT